MPNFEAMYSDGPWFVNQGILPWSEIGQDTTWGALCSRMVAIGALCYGLIDSGTLTDSTHCLPVRYALAGNAKMCQKWE